MEQVEEPIEKADLSKIHSQVLSELVDSKIITEQGVRLQGMGILIRKMERLIELVDKTNNFLFHIEGKIDKIKCSVDNIKPNLYIQKP